MSEPVILVEKSGAVATVTLNRPTAMNALSRELRTAIAETFNALEADKNIRVAILTGAGKAFCAGLDLKELGSDTGGINATIGDKDPVTSIGQFSGPVIGEGGIIPEVQQCRQDMAADAGRWTVAAALGGQLRHFDDRVCYLQLDAFVAHIQQPWRFGGQILVRPAQQPAVGQLGQGVVVQRPDHAEEAC